ncbi:BRCA1 BRCA2-containing complex, subunit 3 [Haplosporangium sp. Z 767]|nr:BRCA1 BRCA2-containing complex, subunit 3 [Haplosporangium sp. Z 767]KAF9181767.1 BRCA1 BRCA2-containing complex, subunit 3 [Haplosporangium sp. Z 11]
MSSLPSTNPFHPDNLSRSTTLSRVLVQSNVLHILLAHALSTEKEEIMGMLMGDWIKEGSSEIARVDGVSLLTRSEKRKDRVEIGPEQLTMAAIEAEHIKLPFSIVNENTLDSLTLPKLLEIPERIFEEQRQSFYKSIPMSSTPTTSVDSQPPLRSNSSRSDTKAGEKHSRLFSLSPTKAFSFSSLSSPKDRDGDTEMSTRDGDDVPKGKLNRSKNDRGSVDDIPTEELSTKFINQRAMSLPDRMTLIRNSGVYVQSLSSLVDNLVGPTLQVLVDREQYNQSLLESLHAQKQAILHQIQSFSTHLSDNSDLVDFSES